MPRSRAVRAAAALLAACAAGCASHEPAPLDVQAIVAAAIERRAVEPGAPPLSLAEAVASMHAWNPRVREAWAEFRVAEAVAAEPTPFANPTISAARLFFQGPDVVASAA